MSYQYVDPYGNHYVRGWGNDFTEEERRELEIGEFNWDSPYYKGPPRGGSLDVDPGRITQGKFQMPGLGNRIEDFLSTLPKAPGLPGKRRIPYYDDNWNAGGSQVNEAPGRTNPEDWIMDGPAPAPGPARIDDTPPMQTPPADVPTPPLEKTLEQRVWERDQMPARTPDAQGRLYPDKKDPGFIDPRVRGDGSMTLQYIPELDDPNWTPWKNYGPGWSREQDWNKGGEGVQYRM